MNLIGGYVSDEFVDQNPVVSRTIEVRGDQTFEALHWAIFEAFGRFDEHMYEFQFGKKPFAPGLRITLPTDSIGFGFLKSEKQGDERSSLETTLDEIIVKKGQKFFYWFDFGDDWWHEIKVESIGVPESTFSYPLVTDRIGENPPQYPNLENDEDYDFEDDDE